jgi:hypothetical protein
MHKEEFEDRELFLAKFGTISTEDQVKELQEILRTYFNLLRCITVDVLCAGKNIFVSFMVIVHGYGYQLKIHVGYRQAPTVDMT